MSDDLVGKALEEWTGGLDPLQSRIALFERIRDMPYEIIADIKDPVEGPSLLLETGRGSCTPKHFLLFEMFRALEVPVQLASYPFYWDDPDIAYPQRLREMAERAPMDYHLACKAYLDDRWALVDATYDPPLKELGFPVTGSWDGVSDTEIAVVALDEILHVSARERDEYTSKMKAGFSAEETAALDDFVAALNAWLREFRG